MPRGAETVTIIPRSPDTDPLRDPVANAPAPYDLDGCHVIPRASTEQGRGYVGIDGYEIYYYGPLEVDRTSRVTVRGVTQNIEGKPQDFQNRGRRKALKIVTEGVS